MLRYGLAGTTMVVTVVQLEGSAVMALPHRPTLTANRHAKPNSFRSYPSSSLWFQRSPDLFDFAGSCSSLPALEFKSPNRKLCAPVYYENL
ncbi:hypothetical protein DFH06DRAFT_773709 [Mycena polygramma]|nr:hypothetical protein DFH06DRAFT_773709 [Mycena polygramma]